MLLGIGEVEAVDPAILNKAIGRYNMYRSPEASVKLVETGDNWFTVEFSGTFCRSCGVRDWLEDLIYELKEIDPEVEVELAEWKMISEGKIAAKFEVKAEKPQPPK